MYLHNLTQDNHCLCVKSTYFMGLQDDNLL